MSVLKDDTKACHPCPDTEVLTRFASGELDPERLTLLEEHLDQCETCQDQLVRLLQSGGQPSVPSNKDDFEFLQRPPGTIVAGRYTIRALLGYGGMGEVYEAFDQTLNEEIALKFLSVTKSTQNFAQLKSEVQLARRIGHPNVCRVFDLGIDDNGHLPEYFLTMELLTGGSLRQALQLQQITLADVNPIAQQLCAGLTEAHRLGILHRDFKSDNVLFRAGPHHIKTAVIADFGLARTVRGSQGHITTGSPLVGTVSHMAPEQVEGGQLSSATDVYGLGVVIFEMLTGRLPFLGTTPLSTALMHLKDSPPRPSTLATGLDPQWDELVLACLAKSPTERPTTEWLQERLAQISASTANPSILEPQDLQPSSQPADSFDTADLIQPTRQRAFAKVRSHAPLVLAVAACIFLGSRAEELPGPGPNTSKLENTDRIEPLPRVPAAGLCFYDWGPLAGHDPSTLQRQADEKDEAALLFEAAQSDLTCLRLPPSALPDQAERAAPAELAPTPRPRRQRRSPARRDSQSVHSNESTHKHQIPQADRAPEGSPPSPSPAPSEPAAQSEPPHDLFDALLNPYE